MQSTDGMFAYFQEIEGADGEEAAENQMQPRVNRKVFGFAFGT